MVFKQFFSISHSGYNHQFVLVDRSRSKWKQGNDLYGGDEYSIIYTRNFRLELVYDKA